jgi:hypothetical protein
MNWDDWEMIWRRPQLPLGAAADLASLRQNFERTRRQTAKALLARDFLEAAAGVIVTGALGLIWWQQGKAGWPIALAMALMLGVTGVFLRERLRTQRSRLGPDASLLAKLDAEIAGLRHQRQMFLHVWQWYLGPIAAAIGIVFGTLIRNRPPWDVGRDPLFIGGFSLFFAFCVWFAWEINRRAVRQRLELRIEELEKLRRDVIA